MEEAADITLAFTGGLGSELTAPHGMAWSLDDGAGSDDANDRTDSQDVEMTNDHSQQGHPYAYPDINMTDTGEEDPRRPRFVRSDDGNESDGSSVAGSAYTASLSSGRGIRGELGGGNGSVFSEPRDGMTKASKTTAESVAGQQGHMVLPVSDEVPAQVTTEHAAPPAIGLDGYYQTGRSAETTGLTASSASAINAKKQRGHHAARDQTEIVAHLPCEFWWYTGCRVTFALHASGRGLDDWTHHMVTAPGHLNGWLPELSACWFCDKRFDITPNQQDERRVRAEVYKKRMRHIAEHVKHHDVLPATLSEKDDDFKKHLSQHNLWQPAPAARTVTYNTRPDKKQGPPLTRYRDERRRQHNPAVGSSSSSSTPRHRVTTIIQQETPRNEATIKE